MDERSHLEEGVNIHKKGDPGPRTPRCCTRVVPSVLDSAEELYEVVPDGTPQHFSTPLTDQDRVAARLSHLEYKSFFNVECEKIIRLLRQTWSASKRKLEELDISTIEAEPPPLYCTPNSVLDDTTYRAKRRRIRDPAPSVAGLLNPVCRSMAESDGESVVPKRKLFPTTGKRRHSAIDAESAAGDGRRSISCSAEAPKLVESQSSVLKEKNLTPGEVCDNPDPESRGGSMQPLEFRSFFLAECEAIYHRLKSCGAKRPTVDVSTIDAEPPPNLSSSITFLSELDSSHVKANSCFGVTQLDLEKMNFNRSVTNGDFSVQKVSDLVPYSSNEAGPMKGTVIRSIEDMRNMNGVGSVADATQDIVIVCDGVSPTNATQDIMTMCDGAKAADGTQDIVTMCDGAKAADGTLDIVTMCDGVKAADGTQDIVTMCDGAKAADGTLDIVTMCDGVKAADGTQDIVTMCDGAKAADGTLDIVTMCDGVKAADGTQDIVTMCDGVKAADGTQDIVTMCDGVKAADGTQDIVTMCDGVKAADGTQDIVTMCDGVKAADATQDIVTMYNGEAAADTTQVKALDATQDIVTACGEVSAVKSKLNISAPDKLSFANATQDIVTEHENFIANLTQDVEMAMNISVANATQEIVPMCDENDSNAAPKPESNSRKIGATLTKDTGTVHDDVSAAGPKISMFCNGGPSMGRTLNTTMTHSFQGFKTKLVKLTSESTLCNVRKTRCVVSAPHATHDPKTNIEAPVLDMTRDIVTIPGKPKKCVTPGDTNIPKRSHSAINVSNGIKNTTFLCTERKPDQNGATIGYTGDDVPICKESLSASNISSSTINSTATITDSATISMNTPSMRGELGTQVTKGDVMCNNPTTSNPMATLITNAYINWEIKESNTTPSNSGIIAANCTLLSVGPEVTQPKTERGCRKMSMVGVNTMDSLCDLDGMHIANEESVFCKGSFSFVTSTPLPSNTNHIFIKKSSVVSVQPNPKLKDGKQMAIPKPVSSGQSTRGNVTRVKGVHSQDFPFLCPSRGSLPKVAETSRLPNPGISIPSLRYPGASTIASKTPQITRSVTLDKAQLGLNGTNRIPADASTGLLRRNYGLAQNGATHRMSLQKGLASAFRPGKDSLIKEGCDIDGASFVRAPVQMSTPANGIRSGKIPSAVSGPLGTARDSRVSFLPTPQSAGSRMLGFVRPGVTFIRTPQPAGPPTTSKLKPYASGLPVKRLQVASILRSTRGSQ